MSRFNFKDKIALITGGSRGLGLSLAWNILERGGHVALLARDESELNDAYRILRKDFAKSGIMTVVCDVTNRQQLKKSFQSVIQQFSKIDVVVNNAGAILVGPFATMKMEDFEAQIKLHLYAAIDATQLAYEHFKSRGSGRILNICSLGGKIGVPHMSPYDASKFALSGFAQGVGSELANENIIMTTAYPTVMRTGSPIQAVFKGDTAKEFKIFETLDNLPLLSLSADRAAKRILNGVEKGKAEVLLTLMDHFRVAVGTLFPNLTRKVLSIAVNLMPKGQATKRKTGAQSSVRRPRTKEEKMYNQKPRHNAEFNLGL